jgi:glyceraldehyde 3-phosphate dehydrogenase
MEGKLTGMALNVPVPDGSTVDLTCRMSRPVDRDQVNEVIRSAAASSYRQIIEYEEDPIVSSDVIGNPHSAIFDSLATMEIGGDLVKVLVWYDNGWGYATRVVELIERFGAAVPGGAS